MLWRLAGLSLDPRLCARPRVLLVSQNGGGMMDPLEDPPVPFVSFDELTKVRMRAWRSVRAAGGGGMAAAAVLPSVQFFLRLPLVPLPKQAYAAARLPPLLAY